MIFTTLLYYYVHCNMYYITMYTVLYTTTCTTTMYYKLAPYEMYKSLFLILQIPKISILY